MGIGRTNIDVKDLIKLRDNIKHFAENESEDLIESCAKYLAARLLARVKKDTPTGKYDKPVNFTTHEGKEVSFTPKTGKMGGTLKRAWTIGEISHHGNEYTVEIINPVEYAVYVEYGHRTPNHKGWVKGKFMLTINEKYINERKDKIIARKIQKKLKEVFE